MLPHWLEEFANRRSTAEKNDQCTAPPALSEELAASQSTLSWLTILHLVTTVVMVNINKPEHYHANLITH